MVLGLLCLALGCVLAVKIDFENVQYPLDAETQAVAFKAGLVTSLPDIEKEAPFVVAPFGVFGRECVHGTQPGAHVTELPNGDLSILQADGTSYIYPGSKYGCNKRFAQKNLAHRRQRVGESALWQDGWLDNGWYFPAQEIGSFTSNYTVPQSPKTQTNNILFWFIGLESSNSDLAILQPVLTWNNIVPGWSFSSWYCCPSGIPNYATPVQGFGPGDSLYGTIKANTTTSGSDFVVNSCVGTNCSPLSCPAQGRVFVNVDTTLETYSITNCTQFATGPMKFTDMQLNFIDGSKAVPDWTQLTAEPTECSGSITFTGALCIIEHQDS